MTQFRGRPGLVRVEPAARNCFSVLIPQYRPARCCAPSPRGSCHAAARHAEEDGGAGEGESGGGDGGGGPAGGSGGGGDGDGGGGGGRGGGFEGGEGGGGNGGGGRCGGGKGSHSRVHLWWSRWQSLTSPVHIRHSMQASKSAWVGMRLIGAKFAMGGGDRGRRRWTGLTHVQNHLRRALPQVSRDD